MDAEHSPSGADPALALSAAIIDGVARARYRLAAAMAPGRRILDAGCGQAVGTRVLAEARPGSLVGVDRAASKLDAARPDVGDAFELRVAELAALPFPDASFDLITCFGPLSDREQSATVLRELRRVLVPDGLLLASLDASEADGLRAVFPITRVIPETQHVVAVAGDGPWLADDSAPAPKDGADGGDADQILLAASDVALPDLPTTPAWVEPLTLARLLVQGDDLRASCDELANRLGAAERALAQRNAAALALAETESRLAVIPDLEARLLAAERRAELAEAERQSFAARADELQAEAAYHRAALERAEATLEAVTSSTSWKATAPIRRVVGRTGRGGGRQSGA